MALEKMSIRAEASAPTLAMMDAAEAKSEILTRPEKFGFGFGGSSGLLNFEDEKNKNI